MPATEPELDAIVGEIEITLLPEDAVRRFSTFREFELFLETEREF